MRRRFLALLAGFHLIFAATGCQSIQYYRQAIHGQCQVLARQRPIARVIQDPGTPAELRSQLRLALELRGFAADQLRLPVNGQYLRYVDLKRPYAVWNVHAAPEFSLEPKAWRYPVIGRVTYRGYFSENGARDYAGALARRGYDVYVEGVEAYSTLGWFKDPVLNTWIFHPEPDLAETLFHELAHQRLFISGDTDFNEAFATAVAEIGVRQWLEAGGDPARPAAYAQALRRRDQFVSLVLETREKLEALYAARGSDQTRADAEQLRREKELLGENLRRQYARLREEWGRSDGLWLIQPLNNAQLNTVATYYHLVPAFRRIWRSAGEDWEKFYRTVDELSRLPKAERQQRLLEGTTEHDGSEKS